MERITLKVPGVSCSHCEKSIKNALSGFVGVENTNVDLEKKIVTFDYDSSKASLEKIKEAIEDEGYDIAG
jgi:copper chaperone